MITCSLAARPWLSTLQDTVLRLWSHCRQGKHQDSKRCINKLQCSVQKFNLKWSPISGQIRDRPQASIFNHHCPCCEEWPKASGIPGHSLHWQTDQKSAASCDQPRWARKMGNVCYCCAAEQAQDDGQGFDLLPLTCLGLADELLMNWSCLQASLDWGKNSKQYQMVLTAESGTVATETAFRVKMNWAKIPRYIKGRVRK